MLLALYVSGRVQPDKLVLFQDHTASHTEEQT